MNIQIQNVDVEVEDAYKAEREIEEGGVISSFTSDDNIVPLTDEEITAMNVVAEDQTGDYN